MPSTATYATQVVFLLLSLDQDKMFHEMTKRACTCIGVNLYSHIEPNIIVPSVNKTPLTFYLIDDFGWDTQLGHRTTPLHFKTEMNSQALAHEIQNFLYMKHQIGWLKIIYITSSKGQQRVPAITKSIRVSNTKYYKQCKQQRAEHWFFGGLYFYLGLHCGQLNSQQVPLTDATELMK
jgi:hypothetical protein